MKLKGRITLLINRELTSIEIADIELTPEQLNAILSRQGDVSCEITYYEKNQDMFGKQHECNDFDFEIPKELNSSKHATELHDIVTPLLSDGWIADKYYGSQSSFFTKDGI